MEFDANDLKMEVRFLDVTFQKGNSLGDLHNRNLDHNNIPRFADTYSLDLTPSDLSVPQTKQYKKCQRSSKTTMVTDQ